MPRLCLALLLFWLACPTWAAQPAPLASDDLRLSLAPYAGYHEDASGAGRSTLNCTAKREN